MTAEISSPAPARRSRLKWIGIILGGILVLLIAAYFLVTSSGFVKAFILPRVGAALNATITADEVSLSPFSRLDVKGLRVRTIGTEALLTAPEAHLRYSLMPNLKGIYTVHQLRMNSPVLHVFEGADGTSNLDPVMKALETDSTEPLQLAVRNVVIQDGRIYYSSQNAEGVQKVMEMENLDLTLDRLENGQPGKVTVASDIFYRETPPAGSNLPPSSLQAKLNGAYDFQLTSDLMPHALQGTAQYQIAEGRGGFQEATGLNGILESQVTPTEIQRLALRFERGGQLLGQIRASGPFDATRMDGRVRIEVSSIDRQVLNLLGAARGWDFGNSVLNSTNLIAVSQEGKLIVASGGLAGNQIGLRTGNQATPEMNLRAQYEVSVDLNKSTALLQQLDLRGLEGDRPVLEVQLEQPMSFSWSGAQAGFKDSALTFAIRRFPLGPWLAPFGDNLPSGVVELQGRLNSQRDGQVLHAEAQGRITELSAQWQTNTIQAQEITLSLDASAQDLKQFTLNSFHLKMADQNQAVAGMEGSGAYNQESGDYRLLANLDASLPGLLRFHAISNLQVRTGRIRYNGIAERQKEKQNFSGSLSLGEFSGRYNDFIFHNYGAGLDYTAEVRGPEVRLQRATLKATQGFDQGGSADISGIFNTDTQNAQFKFLTVGLNENALEPIVLPFLAPRRLTSVTLNSTGQVAYVDGRPDIQADLKLANLAMSDINGKPLAPPLEARLSLDAGMKTTNRLELRKVTLALEPTQVARNQLDLTGVLDFSKTNATSGQLNLQTDSLDLTPVYALYKAPQTNETSSAPAGGKAADSDTPSHAEAPPIDLPVGELAINLRAAALTLGEVRMTNWQTAVRIIGSQVAVAPFDLFLNGRPVQGSANLDLSRPGYSYRISLKLDGVPVEPLARTFLDAETRDMYHGELHAQGQIEGAGTTGASLQKTLSGQFSMLYTNANMALLSPRAQRMIHPVAALLRVPELTQTPLDIVETRGRMGNGVIEVQRFMAASGAFKAESKGQIVIADVLTNSPLNFPVIIALSRSLAEKANLVPENTPTNLEYVPLPQFAKVEGTLGAPETKTDKAVLAGLLLRSVSGLPSALGSGTAEKVGDVMQGLGNLLSGNRSTNSAAGTNRSANRLSWTNLPVQIPIGTNRLWSGPGAAQSNAPAPAVNPFDLLRGVLQKQAPADGKSTNPPPKSGLP